MNRTEIIDEIAERRSITKADAAGFLDTFLDVVTSALKKGDPVVILNFGTLTVKTRAARQGRNPSTGEVIRINAAKVVGFKAGKALKDAVKEEAIA